MTRYRFFAFVIPSLLAINVWACSVCADAGTIEKSTACKVCSASGKVFPPPVPCTACAGRGFHSSNAYRATTGTYSNSRKTCRTCGGDGMYQPPKVTCSSCGGRGKHVERILCPACKGGAALNETRGTAGRLNTAPAPANGVSVDACTTCDANGNVSTTVKCEICEQGWNHEKNQAGKYVCRNCKAVCEGRFTPCACKKLDCPHCKGEFEKKMTDVCPLCGGDKIITPLERQKAQKKDTEK